MMKSRMLALMAWLFASCLPLAAEAHCFCQIAADQGTSVRQVNNPVMNFGQIATYTGLRQQGEDNQKDCAAQCARKVAKWKADKTALCMAFGTVNGASLKSYNAVGTHDYGWGETIPPSLVNFPNGCAASVLSLIYPKYQVLTLLYAPPGCTGSSCVDQGEVDYQSGASFGTKVSTDKSFKDASQISVDVTLGSPEIASFKAGGSFGFSVSTTDSSSETISGGQIHDLKVGGVQDGIDHDRDLFFILMNPAVLVKTQGTKSWWNMGFKGKAALMAQISVAELKKCSFSSNSPFNKLSSNDCNVILKLDPFASGSTAIDSKRFVQTSSTYSYTPSSSCGVVTDSIQHERDTDTSHTAEVEYTVGYSIEMSGGIKVVALSMKNSEDFTWTNTSSVTSTTGSTQAASFKLPCPATDTGRPWIEVYWDTLYGTFMFMPRLESEMGLKVHHGHVSNPSGKPMPRQLVQLSYGGKTYRTSTNPIGEYQFFAPANIRSSALPPTGQLSVAGIKQVVPLSIQNAPGRLSER